MTDRDYDVIAERLKVGSRLMFESAFFKAKGLFEIVDYREYSGFFKATKYGEYNNRIYFQKVGKRGQLLKNVWLKTHFCYREGDIVKAIRCGLRGDNQKITVVENERV